METGQVKKVLTLIAGVLVAYLIASALSDVVVIIFHLTGPSGMVISFIVYAVIFFAMLNLLQKYAHIVFFGFDRE
jgi:hypothetical protein